MRTKDCSALLVGALALLASGCTPRGAGFTAMSDRNIKTKEVKVSELPKTRNVVGSSTRPVLLFFTLGTPTIKEALEDALNKANGDLMLDASLYTTNWWFIFGSTGYELRGTVVNTQKGAAQ